MTKKNIMLETSGPAVLAKEALRRGILVNVSHFPDFHKFGSEHDRFLTGKNRGCFNTKPFFNTILLKEKKKIQISF